jgi:hypothetical protein
MTTSKTCPKCSGRMETGFIVDAGDYGAAHVSRWQPGEPRKSFWTGLKIAKAAMIEVTTLRCGRCGFLESYATPSAG